MTLGSDNSALYATLELAPWPQLLADGALENEEKKAQRGIGTARRGTSTRGPEGWAEEAGTWLYPQGNCPRL